MCVWGGGAASQYQRHCPPASSACPPALASRQRCAASHWPLQPPINQSQLQPLVHRRLASSRSAALQSAGSGEEKAGGFGEGRPHPKPSVQLPLPVNPTTAGRRQLQTHCGSSPCMRQDNDDVPSVCHCCLWKSRSQVGLIEVSLYRKVGGSCWDSRELAVNVSKGEANPGRRFTESSLGLLLLVSLPKASC